MANVKTPFCFETQGPCGSVRTCRDDMVTYHTSAQVENVTPVTLCVTFTGKKRVEVRGTQNLWRARASEASIGRPHVTGTRQLHKNEIGLYEHCEHG